MTDGVNQKNNRLIRLLFLVAVAMFGFGYALVPLYDVLCELTGLNGKFSKENAKEVKFQVDNSRQVEVEFMAELNKATPLKFRPETTKLMVHPGAYYTTNFYAENLTDKTLVAQAIPSFSPGLVADFFNKTECFCFTQQTFKPREKKTMPVRFVINPALPQQYKIISLAYTFFDNTEKSVH